jgi:hypothetical protein
MNIYLIKDGQNAGPYSETEVRSRIATGIYTLDDFAWFEGCTAPVTIGQVFAKPPMVTLGPTPITAPVTAPVPPVTSEFHSAKELNQIADLQRNLTILGLSWIAYCFLPESYKAVAKLLGPLVLVFWLYFGWKLSRLLREQPWVWVIFSLIPLANFYAWGRIIWTATKTLRANGVPCGIMGADRQALNRLGKTA